MILIEFYVEAIESMVFWIFRRPMSSILEGSGNKERKRRNAICDAVQKSSAMSTGESEWKRNGTEWNNYDESAISLNWKVFGSDLIFSVGIRRYIEMAVCTLYLYNVHIHLISCIFIDAVDTWRRVVKSCTARTKQANSEENGKNQQQQQQREQQQQRNNVNKNQRLKIAQTIDNTHN